MERHEKKVRIIVASVARRQIVVVGGGGGEAPTIRIGGGAKELSAAHALIVQDVVH